MLRIVIPTIRGYLGQEIDPGGKRCLDIRAGLNRREVSGLVANEEGGGDYLDWKAALCTQDDTNSENLAPKWEPKSQSQYSKERHDTSYTPRLVYFTLDCPC